jgi:3-methyladenine DNA glycosylase/8-oxoguanine DNA glycosylase
MVRTAESLHPTIDELARREAAFARLLEDKGRPEPRSSEPGVGTLLRTIVGQQVSVAGARTVAGRIVAAHGGGGAHLRGGGFGKEEGSVLRREDAWNREEDGEKHGKR